MKLFIVFSSNDLKNIKSTNIKRNIILGDVNSKLVKKPSLNSKQEEKIILLIKNLFKNHKKDFLRYLNGFINKFYQSSVFPITSYINTLDYYIKNNSQINEIVFPYKISSANLGSTYNLAEHEVQTKLLYNRNEVIQPYLELYCIYNNLKISYTSKDKKSYYKYKIFIKKLLIFYTRFFVSQIKSLFYSIDKKIVEKDFDILAISRLPRKSEYLYSVFSNNENKSLLICNDTFLNFNSNFKFSNKYLKNFNLKVHNNSGASFFNNIYLYIKVYFTQFFVKNIFIEFKNIKINLTYAFKELIIDYADLVAYIKSNQELISKLNIKKGILLSTELKSPYAYADYIIAKKNNLNCVHIMDCDLPSEKIPYPLFGDLLLTNTEDFSISYSNMNKDFKNKIKFWGNLSYFNMTKFDKKSNIWCFFTSSISSENKIIFDKLLDYKVISNINFIVKVHPRDNKNYYLNKGVSVISDDSISKNNLFNEFNYAITFNSAIIHDLFIYDKPFFIIDYKYDNFFNIDVHSNSYKYILFKNNNFIDNITNNRRWIKSYRKYQIQYSKKNLKYDINSFMKNLVNYFKKQK